jgi:hypothetical protein
LNGFYFENPRKLERFRDLLSPNTYRRDHPSGHALATMAEEKIRAASGAES